MTPDIFRNVRIKMTSVPVPDSYERSVTMARGKPYHLWYKDSDAVNAFMPTAPHSTRKSRKLSPQHDEAMVSLFRRLQINLMGLKI